MGGWKRLVGGIPRKSVAGAKALRSEHDVGRARCKEKDEMLPLRSGDRDTAHSFSRIPSLPDHFSGKQTGKQHSSFCLLENKTKKS